jgi:hypothetical protein
MESLFDDNNVETRRFWLRKIQYGDDESSDEHTSKRIFNPDACVLSILEGFGHEIGITLEAFRGGFLTPRLEALLMALFYYLVVKPQDNDQWTTKVSSFVQDHKNAFYCEQNRMGRMDDYGMLKVLEEDRKKCFQQWEIYQYETSSVHVQNDNYKKRKRMHTFVEDEFGILSASVRVRTNE